MVLGVNLPKSVYIDNARLFCLHVFLVVLTLTGIVIKFVYYQEWGVPAELDVGVAMWVPHPDATRLQQHYNNHAMSEWCTSSVTREHVYGERPEFRGCAPPCQPGGIQCVYPYQLYTLESKSMVLMHTREESFFRSADGNVTHEETYLPEATGLSVAFAYAFKDSDGKVSSSTKNIRTQLRKKGKVVEILDPQPIMQLSIQRLLDLAASPPALAVPHDSLAQSGPSQVPAIFTGVELQIMVACNEINRDAPTCAVDVEFIPAPRVFREESATMPDGSSYARTVHGIRVVAIGKGSQRIASLTTFVNSLTTALVLLTLPRWIIYIIAAYCLGHLSSIYAAVVHENFDLTEQVAGMATRLMTSSALFLDLQDEDGCIARECMRERLMQVFRELEGKLNDEEVNDFCNFCFHGVVAAKSPEDPMNHIVKDIKDQMHMHKSMSLNRMGTETEGKKITATQFNMAYSSIEQVSFSHVVELFDVERQRGILEKFFSPDSVKKYVIAKAHRKKHQMATSTSDIQPAVETSDIELETVEQTADSLAADSLAARKRMIMHNSQRTAELGEITSELDERTSSVEFKMEEQRRALEQLREDIENVQKILECKWNGLEELNACTWLQLQNAVPMEPRANEAHDPSGPATPGKLCIV